MKKPTGKAEQNKALKRKAIFKSAIENFAKNGFYGTSMADVAHDAGIADGTLYLYYKNKDDLLIKVFEEMVNDKLDIIQNALQNESDPVDKLFRLFQYHIDLFTNNPSYVKFFVQEIRQSPDFYKKYPDFQPIKKYLSFIEDLIREGIEKGLLREMNPRLAAQMIYGSIDFILSEWALNKEEFPLKDIYKKVIDIFHNGMKKD